MADEFWRRVDEIRLVTFVTRRPTVGPACISEFVQDERVTGVTPPPREQVLGYG